MAYPVLCVPFMENTEHTPDKTDAPYLCGYSRAPFADCYCRKVTGRTVPNIVLYCMERYRECPVYKRLQGEDK